MPEKAQRAKYCLYSTVKYNTDTKAASSYLKICNDFLVSHSILRVIISITGKVILEADHEFKESQKWFPVCNEIVSCARQVGKEPQFDIVTGEQKPCKAWNHMKTSNMHVVQWKQNLTYNIAVSPLLTNNWLYRAKEGKDD